MKRLGRRWRLRTAAVGLVSLAVLATVRPAARAWEKWQRDRWHASVFRALHQVKFDDSPPDIDVSVERAHDGDAVEDDPTLRRLFNQAYFGTMTPDVGEQVALAAQRELRRWPNAFPHRLAARGALPNGAVVGQSWVNLGPTDARIQQNGAVYMAVDSGRGADIRVDPRNKDVVYFAVAWGGIWKTYNFTATQPTWIPITDTVATDVIGAFELDPNNPDTLYFGTGDQLDNSVAGGAIYKSTDGGGSWTMLTARLSGAYANGRTESAVAIRDIEVDRADANKLLVATDIGLFRSTDGGSTFSLVQLPTAGTAGLETAMWTIAYLGKNGMQSGWVVSGMYACGPNLPPPGFGGGEPPNPPAPAPPCAGGTPGDIWRSVDSGATWTSLRAAGTALPTLAQEVGRMALAAGNPANYPNTVVYAQVANISDLPGQSTQLAVTKSTDGGQTFAATAGTTVSNPTTASGNCVDLNVAHDQAWYNLAIAVDPTNDSHVLQGGNLCGVRSNDGGATWDNVSIWLPANGDVGGTTLPYVHADWHAIHMSTAGGSLIVFAGSDGGIFSSSDVFSAATGQASTWNYTNNRGMATHLFYGISSGDPTAGDQDTVYGGLQDNGTRFRDLDPAMGKPTTFNQVVGGDGIGTALARPTGLANPVFWGSLPGTRMRCTTGAVACSQGSAGWTRIPALAVNPDTEPFLMRYSAVEGDTTGAVISASTFNVYKLYYTGTTQTSVKLTSASFTPRTRNVVASPFVHTDCGAAGGQTCRLYGVALTGGNFSVGTDVAGTVTWANAPALLGIGTATNMRMSSTTSIAFPSVASHFAAGKHDGQVYIATSSAPRLADQQTVVPDSIGRIFLTTDGGATYTPFHGNGTSDLPNVPQQVVVFDPSDATDNTIFVGNDLGVYQSTDMGKTWHRYGVGLPMVRVVEIRIAKNSGLMRVGTYGRGLWEIYPNATGQPGVRGDGDWDRNLAIDFLDLGATASRMGTTPATTAAPYYDWHLDQVTTPNAIGDMDLNAELAKFGSHP